MNQTNEGKDTDIFAMVPVKRKRGRPRKYLLSLHGENASSPLNRNLNNVRKVHALPGFRRINGDQPRQVESSVDANDVMVGQVVTGVVEAAFDAGYLLSVRIGNSETCLRGVVFKPGRYLPISAENDVAPGVQMIIRNEIPIPNDNYTRAQRYEHHITPHGNGMTLLSNERSTTSLVPANLKAAKGKQVLSVGPQDAIGRGNTVPVVLNQPIHISNGLRLPNQPSPVVSQSAHLASSKGKHVQVANLSNSTTSASLPIVASQPYTTLQLMPQNLQTENNSISSAPVQHEEKMPTEVFTRVQGQAPSQSAQITQSSNPAADRMQDDNSGGILEDEVGTSNQGLLMEPLQSSLITMTNLHPLPIMGKMMEPK